MLKEINPEHSFVLNSGEKLGSLEELSRFLKNIDRTVFEFHVNEQKNDFSNWIRLVFKSKKLAQVILEYDYDEREHIIRHITKALAEHKILVINAGSSSLKFQLIDISTKDSLMKGVVDAIGLPNCNLSLFFKDEIVNKPIDVSDHNIAVDLMLANLFQHEIISDVSEITAIAHRVVHGGEIYHKPVVVDAEVIAALRKIEPLAPLHNPANINCLVACQKLGVPQVAVFDTAFHHTIPKEKFLYGLPYEYYEKYGIRKYGFHGISHEYITQLMKEYYSIKKKKKFNIIVCHLGNGCSITAVKNGKSLNTTMGFTPIDGLIMGTRVGHLDPMAATYIEKVEGIGFAELDNILNKKSGLLGISGYQDMRTLWKNNKDPKAKLAMKMFADRVTHYIGAYIAELNGVNGIIFTGGIGENAYYIRKDVLKNFEYLGLKIDNAKNKKNDFIISGKGSRVECFVIRSNEEFMMAEEAKKLLKI
jgi:acetate kinase